jgi:hypothetical protein
MATASIEFISSRIHVVRDQRVILDSDLAAIYGVTTRQLNQAIKRNKARFPSDFMFRLSAAEHSNLMSQIVTSSSRHGGRRKRLWAFTEHGAVQAANVLRSERAIAMGVFVVRAFVRLRQMVASNKELHRRLDDLEDRLGRKLETHDQAITGLINTIRELMSPKPPVRAIGFTADLGRKKE